MKDLKSFLSILSREYPEEILEVDVGTSPAKFSLVDCHGGAFLEHLKRQGRRPAVLFRGIKTLKGGRWNGGVVFSETATHLRQHLTLGLPPECEYAAVAEEWNRRTSTLIDPLPIPPGEAPVYESVSDLKQMSLFDLPLYRKDEFDARPGWLCGVAVARDPASGRYNCSWHRHHVRDEAWSAVRVNPRHLFEYMQSYRRRGDQRMPLAFVFGHHPAFGLAAASRAGLEVDEYAYAGSILGEPLRITPSRTWGKELMIPADAEVVVEGYLDLQRTEICGPWADIMRYYSPQTLEPVFTPTNFLARKDPVFVNNWTGHDGISIVGSMTEVFSTLKKRFPRVTSVHEPALYTWVIQFKPLYPGETTRLGMFALGAFGDLIKNVIIVDEDIDPFDLELVMFALSTRLDPATPRLQVIQDLLANRHDPSAEKYLRVGGLFLDCTKPVGGVFPELGKTPQKALEEIRLQDFLSPKS